MPVSLTAAQTARRLDIKPATLYAYVSRGLLHRERTAAGSMFDPLEVEEFAARRRRVTRADTVRAAGAPLMVIDTDVAVVLDDELFFHGRSATHLATESTLTDVARELWRMTGRWPEPDPADQTAVQRAVAALPPRASTLDRLQTAVTVLAASDPLRADATTASVQRAGARILTHLPDALGTASSGELALWAALSDREPGEADRRALQAALILTVDHDLAVSTMAARMAATARGSGYAMVSAALGAFDTPLHGTAATAARQLLHDVVQGTPVDAAVGDAVTRSGGGVPGFGQQLYTATDARAAALLPLVYAMPTTSRLEDAIQELAGLLQRRAGLHPNLDLALAAFTLAADMPVEAPTAIFATGRVVGWIAHGIAEYAEPAMRLRPRGRYVGPLP